MNETMTITKSSAWTVIKCRWCDKILAEVRGPAEIRLRCRDRGCARLTETQVG